MKNVEFEDIIVVSNNVKSSLEALETLCFHSFHVLGEITMDDINALNGMIAAISCLTEKQNELIGKYSLEN